MIPEKKMQKHLEEEDKLFKEMSVISKKIAKADRANKVELAQQLAKLNRKAINLNKKIKKYEHPEPVKEAPKTDQPQKEEVKQEVKKRAPKKELKPAQQKVMDDNKIEKSKLETKIKEITNDKTLSPIQRAQLLKDLSKLSVKFD